MVLAAQLTLVFLIVGAWGGLLVVLVMNAEKDD